MAGLGARKSNADQKYFVGAASQDNFVSGGVAAGPALVKFPSVQNGINLDPTAMWVWGITAVAIMVVLGVHWSFGGRKLL